MDINNKYNSLFRKQNLHKTCPKTYYERKKIQHLIFSSLQISIFHFEH